MVNNLFGLITPMVVIYKKNGVEIDYKKVEDHVEFLIEKGVNGIIANGSTGDFFNLNVEERKNIAEIVIKKTKNRIPVFIGTTALTTKESIDLSRHAEASGANGVMVAPPFYMPLSDNEIYNHFLKISKEISIPIMTYNNPLTTGQKIKPQIIKKLMEDANIKLLKESSGSIENFQNIFLETNSEVVIFIGEELISLECMLIGAKGIISGLSNAIPEILLKLLNFIKNGDYQKAVELHYKLVPIYNFSNSSEKFNYNSFVKMLMKLMGLGEVIYEREPLMSLTKENEIAIEKLIKSVNW